jgi:hypothetical protein
VYERQEPEKEGTERHGFPSLFKILLAFSLFVSFFFFFSAVSSFGPVSLQRDEGSRRKERERGQRNS